MSFKKIGPSFYSLFNIYYKIKDGYFDFKVNNDFICQISLKVNLIKKLHFSLSKSNIYKNHLVITI